MTFVKMFDFRRLGDDRGSLVAIEANNNTPFPIQRVYYIYGSESNVARGFHAHKVLQQLAVCVAGKCTMLLNDGNTKVEVVMNSPTKGILIEPMVWHEMHNFSPDCVLLVLASEHYDESDYIRDYEEFLKQVNQ
ncbi:sugar 3,4-ketoisomerase [Marinobacter halophilus]|uniref:dTDP-6-deoxy-3,4-keto-hexulose isomerase n=1 Tax=Marinobacter halophilus TaxID=1323740 RepID=A0A2T1KCJ2_9GAMM|nr:FdtA/QdtA family cupin domain-containing protein [Marinobacter halophilus]PSF07768.1 dTDP-6-deoxy-3,4-keto-hexulose isomerase [Marinobacter halophilus]GGC56904.1 dTDP-6-deoxy-3,4-keto-hexulose isomerase [Marinobacter halophilus]